MKHLCKSIVLLFFIFGPVYVIAETVTVAEFTNKNEIKKLQYLEQVLSLSIASDLKRSYNLTVNNPVAYNLFIKQKGYSKNPISDNITLVRTAKELKLEILVSCSFIPINKKTIKLTFRIYRKKTKDVAVIDIQAHLTAEISDLITQINLLIISVINPDYSAKCNLIAKGRGVIIESLRKNRGTVLIKALMDSGFQIFSGKHFLFFKKDNVVSPLSYIGSVSERMTLVKSVKLHYYKNAADNSRLFIIKEKNFSSLKKVSRAQYRWFINTFPLVIYAGESKGRGWLRIVDQKRKRILLLASGLNISSDREWYQSLMKVLRECNK